MIRALYYAARLPHAPAPHDTLHLKVYYPALPTHSNQERMTGVIPADMTRAPLPVVIFLNGINVGIESYHWLAVGLAEQGCAVALYTHVAETLPGVVGLSPSLDLSRVRPDTYGSGPTCPALAPTLAALRDLNAQETSPVRGALDLTRVALGGHSAGGTLALQNGLFFPEVRAVFSYAAHTQASTLLGFAPNTILPVADKPTLLISGDRDGVIAASRQRYGDSADPADPVALTFERALPANGASHWALVEGANHFAIAHPQDDTTARAFLDQPLARPAESVRALLLALIGGFVQAHLHGNATAWRAALTAPGARVVSK